MSETPATRTLPIGSAAQALGVTRDNLYKHIERGRAAINGIPFSAQQGPDKRWKVTIPVDLAPYHQQDAVEESESTTVAPLSPAIEDELAELRAENAALRTELAVVTAERDSYKGVIENTHHATLNALERVVERLSQPPALPEPETPKKRRWWQLM